MFNLEQHCKNLEGELDQVKVEIVRILSDKDEFYRENETLKNYVSMVGQLREENVELRKELDGLKMTPLRSTSEGSDANDQVSWNTILQFGY